MADSTLKENNKYFSWVWSLRTNPNRNGDSFSRESIIVAMKEAFHFAEIKEEADGITIIVKEKDIGKLQQLGRFI